MQPTAFGSPPLSSPAVPPPGFRPSEWPSPRSRPEPTGSRPEHPTIHELADLVHEAATPLNRDLVAVVHTDGRTVELGLWPISDEANATPDVLIGWRPDPGIRALALVSAGLEHGSSGGGPVTVTVASEMSGSTATVIERPGGETIRVSETPLGWGADALHRALGLPTPRPTESLSACVEGIWLTHIALRHFPWGEAAPALAWEDLAAIHPLVDPDGDTPTPRSLAAATAALDAEASWSSLLEVLDTDIVSAGVHPPGGRMVAPTAWFDQGSFSRWVLRRQADPAPVLLELLDALDERTGQRLLSALVSL